MKWVPAGWEAQGPANASSEGRFFSELLRTTPECSGLMELRRLSSLTFLLKQTRMDLPLSASPGGWNNAAPCSLPSCSHTPDCSDRRARAPHGHVHRPNCPQIKQMETQIIQNSGMRRSEDLFSLQETWAARIPCRSCRFPLACSFIPPSRGARSCTRELCDRSQCRR